ncbi:PE-PGRS family protein [Mycobacterium bohemicum DSM 44277]|uniref:PE-PGRS family protein n=1 Tax=Mycobacterium bohemicum DSM 44277 TaxID=1236609 RepID=A0A0U0WB96_MYCBE|nr:PE domain-containing protein [Mycobacterium bohemicum]MCV6969625.1 PE domain-containing protein [Mycobacterium bohemicum]CPR12073.1 PE-PGRS family protein [Mycobacterium bohemicum DSM 44277]
MSFVDVAPELVQTAAADIGRIGSAVHTGNLAALLPTTELAAAGADEVSAAIAAVFGAHATTYQAAAAQAATYCEQFAGTLNAAAAAYAGTETAAAASFVADPLRTVGEAWVNSPLGQVLDPIINAPTDVLFGRDLIGTGAAGTPAPATKIVIDFVRHGESFGNAANLIDTGVPGTPLTALGQQQAVTIANALDSQGPFAAIFSSQLLRTQQTAAPLAALLGMPVTTLPGLNEIYAGALNGFPEVPLGVLYLPAPLAWVLGLPLVPMLGPGSGPFSGLAFDQGFTNALQTMYAGAMAHPVLAANGQITDVAYSSEFAIEVGTLMNVKNPDLLLMLTHPLPNTGVVVVQGDPQDGWNLVSWDGVPVPPASLPTELFVDVRDLMMAPQFAAYDDVQALLGGNPATIVNTFANGADLVGTATAQFPVAVTHDIVGALGGGPADSLNPIINVSNL